MGIYLNRLKNWNLFQFRTVVVEIYLHLPFIRKGYMSTRVYD
jgi:hypothetical protein